MKQRNKWLILVVGYCCFIQCVYARGPSSLATVRDPFHYYSKNKTIHKQSAITLEGIVCAGNKRSAAILAHGQKREIVQRGEHFERYKLVVLGKDFVVLQRGKIKKKIFIE